MGGVAAAAMVDMVLQAFTDMVDGSEKNNVWAEGVLLRSVWRIAVGADGCRSKGWVGVGALGGAVSH